MSSRPFRYPFLVLLTLGCLLPAAPALAIPHEIRWRLGRSDFLRYERRTVTLKIGKERFSKGKIVTLHGHDLRDAHQYSPSDPVRDDLPQLFALRLPSVGESVSTFKLDWKPRQTVALRIKGRVEVLEDGARLVHLLGTYSFKSRGKADRKDRWLLSAGKAVARLTFDKRDGVVSAARTEISYKRRDLNKKGAAATKKIARDYELVLKSVERVTPKDFQARVSASIQRGVAHLRTLQEEDGTFKPHGNYRVGSTALAVLTLSICGVPRTDPAIEKALGWIFEQYADERDRQSDRNYDRAVCLMAIDRVFTPQAELELARRGAVTKHVRDLPPQRMAWVKRIAEDLERSAASPGEFGYPPRGRVLLTDDMSNTQYAVLGLRAAAHLGYEVAEKTWLGVIDYCESVCERKGEKGSISLVRHGQAIRDERFSHQLYVLPVDEVKGFRYSTLYGHDHVSSSMTAAGLTCLLVARHELRRLKSKKLTPAKEAEVEQMLRGGWAWLDRHWAMDRHPGHPNGGWYYYFLYSLERACVLDRVKRVGGKDWYYEGAAQLLTRQTEDKKKRKPEEKSDDGSWKRAGQGRVQTPPTCFALLFLKRGTVPLNVVVTGDK